MAVQRSEGAEYWVPRSTRIHLRDGACERSASLIRPQRCRQQQTPGSPPTAGAAPRASASSRRRLSARRAEDGSAGQMSPSHRTSQSRQDHLPSHTSPGRQVAVEDEAPAGQTQQLGYCGAHVDDRLAAAGRRLSGPKANQDDAAAATQSGSMIGVLDVPHHRRRTVGTTGPTTSHPAESASQPSIRPGLGLQFHRPKGPGHTIPA